MSTDKPIAWNDLYSEHFKRMTSIMLWESEINGALGAPVGPVERAERNRRLCAAVRYLGKHWKQWQPPGPEHLLDAYRQIRRLAQDKASAVKLNQMDLLGSLIERMWKHWKHPSKIAEIRTKAAARGIDQNLISQAHDVCKFRESRGFARR